ncbi:insulin receptor substrate 2-like isoform X1 [Lates japonicus]|uniref:Insulin receptor substrate 2-like isoform X1 n=1 Tax=Lates japonicus TaxID=270547 RepID=A0AAD3N4X2_LATJO|nr:insulin receptor substrate 2-like isoform X1 [Lates japonicus]
MPNTSTPSPYTKDGIMVAADNGRTAELVQVSLDLIAEGKVYDSPSGVHLLSSGFLEEASYMDPLLLQTAAYKEVWQVNLNQRLAIRIKNPTGVYGIVFHPAGPSALFQTELETAAAAYSSMNIRRCGPLRQPLLAEGRPGVTGPGNSGWHGDLVVAQEHPFRPTLEATMKAMKEPVRKPRPQVSKSQSASTNPWSLCAHTHATSTTSSQPDGLRRRSRRTAWRHAPARKSNGPCRIRTPARGRK